MEILKGYQKKYLKGLAHGLKPVVFIGQKGLSRNLIGSIHDALDTHELIKVKFVSIDEAAVFCVFPDQCAVDKKWPYAR